MGVRVPGVLELGRVEDSPQGPRLDVGQERPDSLGGAAERAVAWIVCILFSFLSALTA
jgi:hypothetical protein